MPISPTNNFERLASQERERTFIGELWMFLKESKKWWMAPMVLALLLVGFFIFLSGTAAAPFIYTLF